MYMVQSQINCKDVDNKVKNSLITVPFFARQLCDLKKKKRINKNWSLSLLSPFTPSSYSWWRTASAFWGICPIRFTVKSPALNNTQRPYLSTRAQLQPVRAAALALEKAKVGVLQLHCVRFVVEWVAVTGGVELFCGRRPFPCFSHSVSPLSFSPSLFLPTLFHFFLSVLCLDEWFSKGKSLRLVFSRTCEAVHPSHHIILLMHIETPGEITLNLHAFHRHDHT